jgi:hypothetical protein
MSKTFSGLSAGRPSQSPAAKARLMESLKDDAPVEPVRRVNFQVPESKHRKLKIVAARNNQSIKEFLTEYIDSLPNE